MAVFMGAILLLLLVLPSQLLVAASAPAPPPASPPLTMIAGCPTSCGDFRVPYPFGLRLNCSIAQDFNLTCDETVKPPRVSVFGMEVLEILVGKGQLRVTTGQDLLNGGTWMTTGHYSVSSESAVLNWVVDRTSSCKDAVKNPSRYACISSDSVCHTDINATFGYHCECSPGFEGNPYLSGGCQDINECNSPTITCYGNCINTVGSYSCLCPPGTHGDPKQGPCLPDKQRSFIVLGVIIGVSAGLGSLLLLATAFCFLRRWKQRNLKKLKQKHFHQNRGLLLQQLISSDEDIADRTKIFSMEELEKATNKFEESRILGAGGHGTVYKGILSDLRVVAIKKSKIAVQREIDQFINEVAILSQIKHRNVVRLFGCCLETQVPLLVYEFVSNGTLSDHLHNSSLSWEVRLRIAAEAAAALAYLHSAASISIFHRDVKTSNILLDDNYNAKVSDFGASRSIPADQSHVTTMVQGTFGYLDPEYFHTGQLTEKSDVYSFGVILVEILTGEKATSIARFDEERNLATHFIWSLGENRLFQLIEDRIMREGAREEIETVAKLAETCLRLRGEERPTMKDVERHLDALRRSTKQQPHPWAAPMIDEESKSLVGVVVSKESHMNDSTRQYSLEEEYLLSLDHGRS